MQTKLLRPMWSLMIATALTLMSMSTLNAGEAVAELSNDTFFAAKVIGINGEDRVLTLREPNGSVTELKVGNEARNFEQIAVGDQLEISAHNLLDLYHEAPEEQRAGAVVERAPTCEKPAGILMETTDTTVTIKAKERVERAVTLELPDGKTFISKAGSGKTFDTLREGDKYYARLTTSLNISIKLYALLSSKGRPRDGLGHLRKGGRITESPPRASREKARSSTWAVHLSGEARPRPEAVSCFDPDGRCVSVGNFGEIPGEAPKLSNPKQLSYPPRCKGSECN